MLLDSRGVEAVGVRVLVEEEEEETRDLVLGVMLVALSHGRDAMC